MIIRPCIVSISRGTTPGEVASYLVHKVVPTPEEPEARAS